MDQEFLKRLIQTFKVEAEEYLEIISSALLKLEKTKDKTEYFNTVEIIYRSSHSLKGASRTVNYNEIEVICQNIENIFSKMKKEYYLLSENFFDTLHRIIDTIYQILSSSEEEILEINIDNILSGLEQLNKNLIHAVPESPVESETSVAYADNIVENITVQNPKNIVKNISSDMLKISSAKLDTIFTQAEELLSAKLVINQLSEEIRNLSSELASLEKNHSSVYHDLGELNKYFKNIIDKPESLNFFQVQRFIENNRYDTRDLSKKLDSLSQNFDRQKRMISNMVDSLLNDLKKTLLLPFSTILEAFPKMVRSIASEKHKKAELEIIGENIEIDKRILEEIKDPITHIIRNSIDHGIESPEQRKNKNKDITGKIRIEITQMSNNQVEIQISDDGSGIDSEKLLLKAKEENEANNEAYDNLSDDEINNFIFSSGLSTSEMITELSGRGLGLAIVKEKTEKLGGSVTVSSKSGLGTSFLLKLPVKLANFTGVKVLTGNYKFIIPISNIEKVIRINSEQISLIEDKYYISYQDQMLRYSELSDILSFRTEHAIEQYRQVIVIFIMNTRIAIGVDQILSNEEVIVKNLGKQLKKVQNISGATILGNGEVVPVINVYDLVKNLQLNKINSIHNMETKTELSKKSILIAEDSLTSRMLIKNILESSGYIVYTAIDGQQALDELAKRHIDLLISDIEMPRMNGFELISRVRADNQLSTLPAILITSLSSKEDKEKGIDVGANAYIVKSDFEQANLLSIIQNLI